MNNPKALSILLDHTKPSRSIRQVQRFVNSHIDLLLYHLTHFFVYYRQNPAWFLDPRNVMETLDSTELLMEDQTWLDYLWDFETREINLDLSSDTD